MINISFTGWLMLEIGAYPDEKVTQISCDFYDKNDPACISGNCPYKIKCDGSPKAFCFASWKNGISIYIIILMDWIKCNTCYFSIISDNFRYIIAIAQIFMYFLGFISTRQGP